MPARKSGMQRRRFHMKGKLKLNVVFPIATALMALVWIYKGVTEYGLWDAASTSPKDGLFPSVIGVALLVASIVNIYGSLKEDSITFGKKPLILIAALALIYVCTDYIGLLPSLLIFYVAWLKLYARVDWKTTIITTAAVFAVIYFGFSVWLQIRFPVGTLFQMLG